ncbi:cohesin domain-containing protein [Saliphagus infecundisoli]|uniref:Cohesin domain-containing protein n=1 Tax=Saliphagus infecundisoli TaxID=1849069 RepID=A0ABD5QCM3_9EURY|nr:cohesin domain-containing protein [Saliphagus infecundisoli]
MGPRDSAAAGAVLAVVVAAALVLASGGALAGDNVALFAFEPTEIEADPGEEVTVEIVMTSHGGYGGEGVGTVAFALDYDPDVLSVTDLEAGPWLEGDGVEVAVDREVDEERGEVRLNQSREPAGEGVTGTAPIATATLEVREDAEATNATLTVTGSSVELVDGNPQSTMVRDAVVVVDGGEPTDGGDGEDADPEGVTLADGDASSGEEADGEDDDAADATGETGGDEPSLALLAGVGTIAFVSVVCLAAIALRKRDPGV